MELCKSCDKCLVVVIVGVNLFARRATRSSPKRILSLIGSSRRWSQGCQQRAGRRLTIPVAPEILFKLCVCLSAGKEGFALEDKIRCGINRSKPFAFFEPESL